jgi:hypothetical protein
MQEVNMKDTILKQYIALESQLDEVYNASSLANGQYPESESIDEMHRAVLIAMSIKETLTQMILMHDGKTKN